MKTQLRVGVMALGNCSSDPPAVIQIPLRVELRELIVQCGRIGVSGQGGY